MPCHALCEKQISCWKTWLPNIGRREISDTCRSLCHICLTDSCRSPGIPSRRCHRGSLCRYRTRHQSHPPHCKTDTWAPGRTWRRPWPTPCGSRSRPAPRRTPGSNRSRPALSSCSAGCFCTRRCRSARGSPPHTWCSRPPPGAQGPGAWPAAGGSSCSPKALACLPAGGVVFAGGKQLSKVVAEPLPTRLWVLYTGLPACFPVINFLNPAAALSSCQALLF